MSRQVAYLSLILAAVCAIVASLLSVSEFFATVVVSDVSVDTFVVRGLRITAVLLTAYGIYVLAMAMLVERARSKRRVHDARNVIRLTIAILAVVAVLGVMTEQWLGLLFSLGIVGFAITFALQQPLFSLLGWVYIMVKRPYQVGDRVKIENTKGDVIEVDFLVTTIWEINGELVSSDQPSGRIVTVPNSVVLSSHVYNYSWEEFPYVWNEISVQVSYETDLAFARQTMIDVANDHLGDEMKRKVERYRSLLADTPVELEVRDRPSVNFIQQESWVELQLRYLVHPKNGQRVKNQLYERILTRFNEHADRVSFPVSRNR